MIKGALLIVENDRGQLLLQHKDANAPLYANRWCLFGGGIKQGEEASQAIQREFIEELEWHITGFVHDKSYPDIEVFRATTRKSADELKAKLHEGDALGFFAPKELLALNIAKPHLEIIKDYLKGKEK